MRVKSNIFFIQDENDVDIFKQRLLGVVFDDDAVSLESIQATTTVSQYISDNFLDNELVVKFKSKLYFASYFQVYFRILKLFLDVDDAAIKVEYTITK